MKFIFKLNNKVKRVLCKYKINNYPVKADTVWKRIKDSDYEVSDSGLVRNIHFNRLVNGHVNIYGYRIFTLIINSKPVVISAHRLVAYLFCENPNPDIYNVVNHKNEEKLDNRAANLEWCTQSYNHDYGNALIKQANSHSRALVLVKDNKKIIAKNSPCLADYFKTTNTGFADYIKKKKTYYGYTVRYVYPKEKELLGENPLVIIV